MEVTRRYEAGVVLGCLLAAGAWLFAQPLLFVGAAGIVASLLVQQYRFVRDVLATTDRLSLTQSISRSRVTTDDDTSVVLRATCSEPTSLTVVVDARPPATAMAEDPTNQRVTLADGTTASTTFSLRWPVAGQFDCAAPEVTLSDRAGLFRSTLTMGEPVTVTVVPRRLRELHVGAGGTSIPTVFGKHKTGDRGVGLDPAEIRRYVPGDTVRHIDWKATARTGHPQVREFDAETDLSTTLIFDHRSSMATGEDGETKLDYLRQVALAYTNHARTNMELLSLYTVGDDGVTTALRSDASTRHYARMETTLYELDPTDALGTSDGSGRGIGGNGKAGGRGTGGRQGTGGSVHTPREARAMGDRLQPDDSAFGRTLMPYLAESSGYVQRIDADPLYRTVETYLGGNRRSVMTVLLTDDTHRLEVREAVRAARQRSEQVVVFLAPSILFERGGLGTIETAYDGYVDFEEFRRDLSGIEGVMALEVAPADRIEAVLTDTRRAEAVARGER